MTSSTIWTLPGDLARTLIVAVPLPLQALTRRADAIAFADRPCQETLMQLHSHSFAEGQPIPAAFAFGKPGAPVALSDNRSPHLAWSEVPAGTRSFVLTVIDPDAPSRADDVNQSGRVVPADLPRVEFVHWLMANIPAECRELAAGACSDEVTPRGKRHPPGPPGSVQGINDYTGWFAHDAAMAGRYLGYDGPCPPWNDALLHRYHFTVRALDVAELPLAEGFSLAELRAAMDGHVLASVQLVGSYRLRPLTVG